MVQWQICINCQVVSKSIAVSVFIKRKKLLKVISKGIKLTMSKITRIVKNLLQRLSLQAV